jgi:hypothetical protein
MIANIALDDALILRHRANPRRIEFSGTTVMAERARHFRADYRWWDSRHFAGVRK